METFLVDLFFYLGLFSLVFVGFIAILLFVTCAPGRSDERRDSTKEPEICANQLGNVRKIGLVYCFEKNEDGPGENPLFNDKVVISLRIVPDAEQVWPGDRDMAEFQNHKIGLLLCYGILSFKAYAELRKFSDLATRHLAIATEFPSLNAAKRAFQLAVDAGVGDIYLYENGELRDKLD